MTLPIFKKILLLLLILGTPLLGAEDVKISPLLKNMILNSDHIITGVLSNITTETQGRKTISKGSVKIEDVISSDTKSGEVITVAWETFELSPIHHEHYQGIQVIWLLQKKGNLYYANHPARLQSLDEFESIYNEIDGYSTRVFLPETYYWQDQDKPVLLIFRNIETGQSKLPAIEWQNKTLKIHDKIRFSVYPITSFNRDKTILGKAPLTPHSDKIEISSEIVKELKTDLEYRVCVNLNDIYTFNRASFYSVSLEIRGFPSQSISAFEVRNRMKVPEKFDFLIIAKDRFASEQKKHTVQAMMNAVGEKTVEGAGKTSAHGVACDAGEHATFEKLRSAARSRRPCAAHDQHRLGAVDHCGRRG